MQLPSLDLEMAYWRARRRTQRLRAIFRERASRIRADLNLRFMHLYGRQPERLEPEETFVYRAMWAVVVVGVLLVISIEALGQDEFVRRVDAVLAGLATLQQSNT